MHLIISPQTHLTQEVIIQPRYFRILWIPSVHVLPETYITELYSYFVFLFIQFTVIKCTYK